jgi:hypothetical protein
VGARHNGFTTATREGGYLNNYTIFKLLYLEKNMLSPEQQLKIDELKILHLPRVWIEIAELVGPDLFIDLWKIACTPENQDRNALYVPSINKLFEFQKILLIKQLIQTKKSTQEIIEIINKQGFSTSSDSIRRISNRFNLTT